jgi:superoxide reductase
MANPLEIYECEVCGHVVELFRNGSGTLVCCGQEMKHREANTVDTSKEKHVPVVTDGEGETKVEVGSTAHPMEEDHFIEWIELKEGDKLQHAILHPGEDPAAIFETESGDKQVRAFCNKHGLWKAN